MNSWIPKKKILGFAIAGASFSVLLYFIGLFMILGNIKKIENLYTDASSELFKEEQFLTVKSTADANKQSIQTLRNFFIKKGDEVQFIEKIENMAQSSSIKYNIDSIDVKATSDDSFKEDVNLKMSTEGSWRDTIYFIDKLKKMPFGVSIEKVNLDAKTSGDWAGSVEFIVFREK